MRRGLLNTLAWMGFALLVWGAWLAFPRLPGEEPGPGLRVVMIDGSASVVRRRPGWGSMVRELVRVQAREAEAASEELSVLLVGRDVLRLRDEDIEGGVGWLAPVLDGQLNGSASDLDSAIAAVESELLDTQRATAALVLVGDGEWSGVDPRARLERLARGGVQCERLSAGEARWPDLGLLGVRLPRSVKEGEPLAAVCDLAYWPGTEAVGGELLLERTDSSGLHKVEQALSLPTEGGAWSVSVDLGPCAEGVVEVRARVRVVAAGALAGGDPVGENDRALGNTRSGGAILGLATAEPERLAELGQWLDAGAARGVQWELLAPGDVGARLFSADLLLSYDVSTAKLPEEWLAPFLEGGGGWLAIGGWGLLTEFWPEGVDGSAPSSEWLPLVPSRGEAPAREVLFCVDGSGSMAGDPFESVRGAMHELVRAALPNDQLRLRFFTGALGPVVELGGGGQGDRTEGLRRLLAARVPGGSTAILTSLEALAAARAESELPGLVLLLSDGRDDSAFQVAERSAALRRSLSQSRTELSVIAIGAEADLDLLGQLAGGQEELLIVDEFDDLAEIFRREVARERVREGAPTEVVISPVPRDEEVAELVSAWGTERPLPRVERLARTEARVGSSVPLRTEEDLPLLGLSRVGEGWTAVFPTVLEEGWAPGFRDSVEFWLPLWRFLARGAGERSEEPRLSVVGDDLLLELGATTDPWPPVVRVELRGSGADGRERVMGIGSLGLGAGGVPGVMRRRIGPLGDLEQGGGALWRAHLSDGTSGESLGVLPFVAPLALEFRPFSEALLPLGALGGEPSAAAREGVLVPDPRAARILGAALALLALAALGGRWRAGRG